jgi:UDP:flavonoid glycosyltransferase YjiC (YdhE family)
VSRFLFTTWPVVSHFHPLVGIAAALRDRGHDIAFYTGPAAQSTIDAQGFTYFPFEHVDIQDAGSWFGAESPPGERVIRRQTPRTQYRAFRKWVVETIPGQVADLQPLVAQWRPDVVVAEPSMWGPAMVLWEATPIPVALSSQFMGPLLPGPDAGIGFGLGPPRTVAGRLMAWLLRGATAVLASGLRHRVDEIRHGHGLGPLGCPATTFTGRLPLYLVGSLPELDYNRRDLPASVQYVGPYLWHPFTPPVASSWLETTPTDHPWVHVSEGTSYFQDPFVLRAAVRGLAGRPMEVIVTTGKDRDPDALDLGPISSNIHVTQWLDYRDLLPKCAVVVTMGGTGTVLAALQAGVPLVIVPTAWDQPDNAQRVVAAGAGVRLASRRCTPETLWAAVDQVLVQPRYRECARALARRMAAADGPGRAAELLEFLAAGDLPVTQS